MEGNVGLHLTHALALGLGFNTDAVFQFPCSCTRRTRDDATV
jgi:hypothetical protein